MIMGATRRRSGRARGGGRGEQGAEDLGGLVVARGLGEARGEGVQLPGGGGGGPGWGGAGWEDYEVDVDAVLLDMREVRR